MYGLFVALVHLIFFFFFFQAEDGIRDHCVTGVQTCALPILFGVVAMTILTLFVMGRRNVYSGKQASQAVAVGTQVIEDIGPLNKRMLYNGAFGIADTDTGAAVTLPKVSGTSVPTYANAKVRSTDPNDMSSPTSDVSTQRTELLTQWTALVRAEKRQVG